MNKSINTSMKEYYGYVYIWFDTKYKKFIIGSHHGKVEDKYKTSTGGIHVRNIFKYRPQTMRFRVLQYNKESDNFLFTQQLEQKWLNMRRDIKNNSRYYNMTNFAGGGFDRDIQLQRVANNTHHFLGGDIQRESNHRRIQNGTHNFLQQEHVEKIKLLSKQRCLDGTHHFLNSDFNKIPFILKCSDGREWHFSSKVEAVNFGIKAGVIDKVKKFKEYKFIRGSKDSNKKVLFKPNDIIYYFCVPNDNQR